MDVSYVKRTMMRVIFVFSWQAQYLVKLEGDSCLSAHCNGCLYVKRTNHESDFWRQPQYLVKLEGDSCCSAHCK